MESFSAVKNWNRVAAGFKCEGPFFRNGSTCHTLPFVEGWPSESIAKFAPVQGGPNPRPIDSWNERRTKNV